MRKMILFVVLLLSPYPAFAQAISTQEPSLSGSLEFRGTAYFLRWSEADQSEFTPDGQEDLTSWRDMVTVVLYPNVRDEDGLAAQANAVLKNYSLPTSHVLRTNSVPKTKKKPAEHFIAVEFAQRNLKEQFMEFTQARLVLVDGKGVAIIYSRRSYGNEAPHDIGPWIAKNGPASETALMDFDPGPVVSMLSKKK